MTDLPRFWAIPSFLPIALRVETTARNLPQASALDPNARPSRQSSRRLPKTNRGIVATITDGKSARYLREDVASEFDDRRVPRPAGPRRPVNRRRSAERSAGTSPEGMARTSSTRRSRVKPRRAGWRSSAVRVTMYRLFDIGSASCRTTDGRANPPPPVKPTELDH